MGGADSLATITRTRSKYVDWLRWAAIDRVVLMAKDPGQSLACLEVKTCPLMIVSKAPVVVSNPKNKPLSNSQEVLFTLLNKRFQRYLASQASTSVGKGAKRRLDFEEKKSAENEREVATHRLSLINHQGSQSPEGHGEKAAVDHSCPVRSVRDSTTLKLKYRKSENERQSAPTSPSGNVLNKLGELVWEAEDVTIDSIATLLSMM